MVWRGRFEVIIGNYRYNTYRGNLRNLGSPGTFIDSRTRHGPTTRLMQHPIIVVVERDHQMTVHARLMTE